MAVGAGLAQTLWALATPPLLRVILDSGGEGLLWSGTAAPAVRWIGLAVGLASCAAFWLAGGWRAQRDAGGGGMLHVLAPASLLPLAGALTLLPDLLPAGLVSAFPLAVCALVAACLLRLIELRPAEEDRPLRRGAVWLLLALCVALYAGTGVRLAVLTGEHVGDEGHYLSQARSLYEDGDLDLRNDLMEKEGRKPQAKWGRSYLHISKASRGEAWYSFHPFGLPLLIAPVWGWGLAWRYLLLGCVAALGNVAMYRLAREAGAARRHALAATAVVAVSLPWTMYAARVLPETLGATLLAWLMWAVFSQDRHPWKTAVTAAVCVSLLPVVQERFFPLGLMGFGFYGLYGLFSRRPWWPRFWRLAAFTLLCAAGLGLFGLSQWLMFESGMKYSVKGGFLSYPPGMWHALADARGIVSVFPAFVWLLAATGVWGVLGRGPARWRAATVLAMFAVCLVFSCAYRFFSGGSCVPGRYLVVVLPLLVPGAAWVFGRASRTARGWLLFLALVSVSWLVLTHLFLPDVGRGFILPVHNLRRVHPFLSGLFCPHASFAYDAAPALAATTVFVAGALALTFALLLAPARGAWVWVARLCVAAAVALAVAAHSAQAPLVRRTPLGKGRLAALLQRAGFARVRLEFRGPHPPLDELLRVPYHGLGSGEQRLTVTTRDLGAPRSGMFLSQPRIEANDWDGRGFRWATLVKPHRPVPGRQIIRLAGRLKGEAAVVVCVREGARTLVERRLAAPEGRVSETLEFECRGGAGELYILCRLEGQESDFAIEELYWLPWMADATASPQP